MPPIQVHPLGVAELVRAFTAIASAMLEGLLPHPGALQALNIHLEAAKGAEALLSAAAVDFPLKPKPYALCLQLIKLKSPPSQPDERVKIARVCSKNAYALSTLLTFWVTQVHRDMQKAGEEKAVRAVNAELFRIFRKGGEKR